MYNICIIYVCIALYINSAPRREAAGVKDI